MRVSTISNAGQLSVLTAKRMKDILPQIRKAEQESGRIMKARAKALSQGVYSTATLRQMGHPYALRNPAPPADPAIINKQSGLFAGSWKYQTDILGSDLVRLFVFNDAPWAKYMLGTRKMIARPILEKMTEMEAPARFARLKAAFGDVFRNL